jgi:hypothetical protein
MRHELTHRPINQRQKARNGSGLFLLDAISGQEVNLRHIWSAAAPVGANVSNLVSSGLCQLSFSGVMPLTEPKASHLILKTQGV